MTEEIERVRKELQGFVDVRLKEGVLLVYGLEDVAERYDGKDCTCIIGAQFNEADRLKFTFEDCVTKLSDRLGIDSNDVHHISDGFESGSFFRMGTGELELLGEEFRHQASPVEDVCHHEVEAILCLVDNTWIKVRQSIPAIMQIEQHADAAAEWLKENAGYDIEYGYVIDWGNR